MFAFDRSALAVLAPLVLLLAVVVWSNRPVTGAAPQQAGAQSSEPHQAVAANLPSR
jgi:hypothetical protein